VEILEKGSSGAAITERNAAAILCWTDERNAISDLTIFNNEQVTCVGARVMGTSHDRRATMRQKIFFVKLIGARFSF